MNNFLQLIIVGGGFSIKQGLEEGLYPKLANRLICGINYSFIYLPQTYLCCMNYTDFYNENRIELSKLPLIVTCNRPHPSRWLKNTLLINKNFALSGILALHVGLLLEPKEIFLLGYDFKAINGYTHFYQGDIKHRGIGQAQYYTVEHAERDFEQFKDSKFKIWNVSPDSKIEIFEKINYQTFFKKLNKVFGNQNELRLKIKQRLEEL